MITAQSKRDKSRVEEFTEKEWEKMVELGYAVKWKVIGKTGVSDKGKISEVAQSVQSFIEKKKKNQPKTK